MRPRAFVVLAVLAGAVLTATVFHNDIASARSAAQSVTVDNTPAQAVPVREQKLDGNAIRVHEQGTAQVAGIGIDPGANGVVIENQAADPVPVTMEQPALEPEQVAVTVGLGEGETDDQEPSTPFRQGTC